MKPENIIRIKKTVFMIGVAAMALSAGAAGAALVANAVIGSFSLSSYSGVAPVAQNVIKPSATKVDFAAKSVVVLYKKKTAALALDKIFLPGDEAENGVVLTSDGWIVTSSSALAGRDALVAVFSDKTTAAVDPASAVRDDAAGLAFIKIDGHDLDVASFGDDTTLLAGEPVFSVSPNAVADAVVLAPRLLPVQAKTDYVESTALRPCRIGRGRRFRQFGRVGYGRRHRRAGVVHLRSSARTL
jgi:S1-C subfamily serine protease